MKNISSKKYDVAIAGAGPGGCIAAKHLADKGASVIVFEKGSLDSLGHDWWDTLDAEIFDHVGLAVPQPPELSKPFVWEIVTPLGSTGFTVRMPDYKLNVDRRLLAKRLVETAKKSGAEIVFNARVVAPRIERGAVAGIVVEDKNKRACEAAARISIDATGWKAALRAKAPLTHGFQRVVHRDEFMAGYREIRVDDMTGGPSKLYVGGDSGAKWMSRNEPGLVDIFACAHDVPGRTNPRELTDRIIREEGGIGATIARGGYSDRIPVRRSLDSLASDGLLLIGDCACMANPINGCGVSNAMWAGKSAADAAADALRRGAFKMADLWSHNFEYKTCRDSIYAKLDVLRRVMLSQPPDFFHAAIEHGLFKEDKFWELENELDFSNLPLNDVMEKIPALLIALKHPDFALKLGACFAIMALVRVHYENFPAEYSPAAFDRWRAKTKLLFAMTSRIAR